MRNFSLIVLFAAIVLAVCSCRRQPSERLLHIYALSDSVPAQAALALDSVDTEVLSEGDRNFYDFLRIKVDDKNYVRHSSDSTILRLINFYDGDRRYGSEVLYYAGRVYSDMGDYPHALHYFQQALDQTPLDRNPRLRGSIASQTGRLLNSIRLKLDAIPYLKESLRIDSILNDTVNLMYDHQLLGAIYIDCNQLDSAETILNNGKTWAITLSGQLNAKIDVTRAHLQYLKGNLDSAHLIIRDAQDKLNPKFRSLGLLYAAQIYLAAGIEDSAYYYIRTLLNDSGKKNKQAAYKLLISTNLKSHIPQDSILYFINGYQESVNDYFNTYEAEAALYQNSFFNYQNHVEKRLHAESQKNKLKNSLYIIGIGCLIFLCCFLFTLYRTLKNKTKIKKIREIVEILKRSLDNHSLSSLLLLEEILKDNPYNLPKINKSLKTQLLELSDNGAKGNINKLLLQSSIYLQIKTILLQEKIVSDTLMQKLKVEINKYHHHFTQNLETLFDGPISQTDLYPILLIKCGFSQTEISHLLGRSRSSISERLSKIGKKIFQQKLTPSMVENLIRLL